MVHGSGRRLIVSRSSRTTADGSLGQAKCCVRGSFDNWDEVSEYSRSEDDREGWLDSNSQASGESDGFWSGNLRREWPIYSSVEGALATRGHGYVPAYKNADVKTFAWWYAATRQRDCHTPGYVCEEDSSTDEGTGLPPGKRAWQGGDGGARRGVKKARRASLDAEEVSALFAAWL